MISPRVVALRLSAFVCVAAVALTPSFPCLAYNAPVDQAGPLTVRIVAPQEFTAIDQPLPVIVEFENRADRPITGEIRLRVIDNWRCVPDKPARFTVPAKGKSDSVFLVAAGAGTYSAHYPIHAYATFDWEGEQHTAHPILVLETKLPPAKRSAAPPAWKPFPLSPDRSLALWQLPVYQAVLQVFEQPPRTMPVGWNGSAETNRGSVYMSRPTRLDGASKETIAIHPPWSGGQVGTALVEYPLALPDQTPIKLRFSHAVTPTGTGDGVTFRVRVAPWDAPAGEFGEIVFERHSAAKSWEAAETNLTRFAGKTIRLQLESHPGPKNNTSFDQSYWAEPTLVIGDPPEPGPFPPDSTDESIVIGTAGMESEEYDVRLWLGPRGLLDATVKIVGENNELSFRGFRVRVMGEWVDDPASPTALVKTKSERVPGGVEVEHQFDGIHGAFTLIGRLRVDRGYLLSSFKLGDRPPTIPWFAPRIEEMAVGQFDVTARRVYAGHGNVIENPQAFRLGFDGHRLATSHVGFDFDGGISLLQAVDSTPIALEVDPDRKHYSLHAADRPVMGFIPASNVWQAVKYYRGTNGWWAADGVERLAGRFVFDLWGGRYGESGEQLKQAFHYGLTDTAVVWHNWQRWGYDYRLPEIYPPNPQWGTEDELKAMIDSCRDEDVLFALHDNYIDMYPDADGFSYEKNIAFHGDGRPVEAWLNKGRDARSYRYRSDRVEPYLKANLEVISRKLKPTAYFIDVWSSVGPYSYWTADGKFFNRPYSRDKWGELFAWIRDVLGDNAPQISESGHDQLIGWLDGAQTNHLRVGRPIPGDRGWCVWDIRCDDAERIPWFDAAHHDRFILHGAGYSSRYEAGLDRRLHGMYSDDYLCTEILTGHPAMANRPFGRDVVRKYWLTQDLMRALALRTIEDVEFVDDDIHRQHVRWSGGGQVWVNRGETDWKTEGRVLPPFGFLAKVPVDGGEVVASIHRHEGIIVEQAVSPQHAYVNGRQIASGRKRIQFSVSDLKNVADRRVQFQVVCQADDPIPPGYRPFIHFVDETGEIAFQAGYNHSELDRSRSGRIRLPATVSIPESLKLHDKLEMRIGFYNPSNRGARLMLTGADDGELRYRMGTIEVMGEGDVVTGVGWTTHEIGPDPHLARQNPDAKPIDFGAVVTAGGCRLSRDSDSLLVVPLPDSGSVATTFELNWHQLPWDLPRPNRVESVGADGRVIGVKPVGEAVRIECEPEAFAYRLVTGGDSR